MQIRIIYTNKSTWEIFSNSGAKVWQWEHQGAKKSISQGFSSASTLWKSISVNFVTLEGKKL